MTVMGEVYWDRLSDTGSIPVKSIRLYAVEFYGLDVKSLIPCLIFGFCQFRVEAAG